MSKDINPFHAGELAVQERSGFREKVAKYGPKMVRDHMPDQHRIFFQALPHFFIGSVDSEGRPWASVLWGLPGFIHAPTSTRLEIGALPICGDPLFSGLAAGAELGGLGLMFENRRRNRVNGRVSALDPDGFSIDVTQSFGNCPQYIQTRLYSEANVDHRLDMVAAATERRTSLSVDDGKLIKNADTFFIASAAARLGADQRQGVDVSHRGGKPGFVKILEKGDLLIPDFSGNRFFNTLGNIDATGLAGLLFIDFTRGDLLHVTGEASIIWPEDSPLTYPEAERYIRVVPTHVVRRPGAMPFKWQFMEASPRLPEAGEWFSL